MSLLEKILTLNTSQLDPLEIQNASDTLQSVLDALPHMHHSGICKDCAFSNNKTDDEIRKIVAHDTCHAILSLHDVFVNPTDQVEKIAFFIMLDSLKPGRDPETSIRSAMLFGVALASEYYAAILKQSQAAPEVAELNRLMGLDIPDTNCDNEDGGKAA